MPGCPNDPRACQCVDHHEGLAAYAKDREAYDQALERIRPKPRILSVVTAGPPRPGCNGSMTCPCQACIIDRTTAAPKGAGPAQFKVRPARQRRAA